MSKQSALDKIVLKESAQNANKALAMQYTYALRVALQTMKERCLSLQRRVTILEEQNQEMHQRIDINQLPEPGVLESAAENLKLQLQVTEMQHQKTLLNDHINMLSKENRKLWSRLSQKAKEQDSILASPEKEVSNDDNKLKYDGSPRSTACSSTSQNLIRSKTFTQHSPNPQLRQKLISSEIACDMKDISLEDITLNADNVGELEYSEEPDTELGFAYLNVNETSASMTDNEIDFDVEDTKCLEGFQDLRRELLKQQNDLQSALAVVESRIVLQPCADCSQKSQKPEMADKSLETDDSLTNVKFFNNNKLMYESNLTNGGAINKQIESVPSSKPNPPDLHMNIIQEKIDADDNDKICPMCGKVFSSYINFNEFREHVEQHFIDDNSDTETIIERNYEMVSHSVGDF